MIIDWTSGCICFCLLIDDKEPEEREDYEKAVEKILEQLTFPKDFLIDEVTYWAEYTENFDGLDVTINEESCKDYLGNPFIIREIEKFNSEPTQENLVQYLKNNYKTISDIATLQDFIIKYCERTGKLTDLGSCDCCGDNIINWKICLD